MKHIELTPRLRMVADMIPAGAVLADVGTDHAYLPAALMLEGKIGSAIAADLRQGPLSRAKETVREYGLNGKIAFRLCDGLSGIRPEEVNAVSIAGMGGETIAAILEAAPWTAAGKHKLVLQPMTQAPRLRKWLREHGYRIRQERLAQEGKRLYCLLEVWGGAPDADAAKYGDLFTESLRQDPLFPAFVQAQLTRYSRIAAGQAQSEADGEGEDLQQILTILKEQANGTR